MAGMFAYIAGSPFVFIELFHIPASQFGFYFGANALGFVAVSQLNIRLTRRFETDAVIRTVLVIQTAAGALLVIGTITGFVGLYGTAVLLFVYVASLGCLSPNTTAMAMASQQENAGSASALLGTLQFSLAAAAATLVGSGSAGGALPMAAVVAGCGLAAFLLYRSMVVFE
jgi:DHA1 family bicyclomycin/chloramphenicol resistance-like MFS transporter